MSGDCEFCYSSSHQVLLWLNNRPWDAHTASHSPLCSLFSLSVNLLISLRCLSPFLRCVYHTELAHGVLILSDPPVLPSRKTKKINKYGCKTPATESSKYQEAHNDSAKPSDDLFLPIRDSHACLLITAGFIATYRVGVTFFLSIWWLLMLLLHYNQANQEG